MFKLVLVLSLCTLAYSLKCYDCDPTDEGSCRDPTSHNYREKTCTTESAKRVRGLPVFEIEDEEFRCVTMNFIATESTLQSGIYRGCVKAKENVDTNQNCDQLLDDSSVGKVTSCHLCKEDKCNDSSGVNSFTYSLVTVFGAVLCFYVLSF